MKNIFDESELKHLKLRNRIFRSATWEALADADGNLTAPLYEIYRELAAGGVGAIVIGITTVSPHDALLKGIVQFHSDKFINRHKKLTDSVHEQTAIVDSVCQLPANKFASLGSETPICLERVGKVRK